MLFDSLFIAAVLATRTANARSVGKSGSSLSTRQSGATCDNACLINQRQMVTQTIDKFATALDNKSFDDFKGVFTSDATCNYGFGFSWNGVDAISSGIKNLYSQSISQHLQGNYDIEFDGSGTSCTATTYVKGTLFPSSTDHNIGDDCFLFARYKDTLVYAGGSWKISSRALDFFGPGLSGNCPMPTPDMSGSPQPTTSPSTSEAGSNPPMTTSASVANPPATTSASAVNPPATTSASMVNPPATTQTPVSPPATTSKAATPTTMSTVKATTTPVATPTTAKTTTAAPTPTFSCDKGGYLIQDTTLLRVDLNTGKNVTVNPAIVSSGHVNAIGFNTVDNYIYGVHRIDTASSLIKIGANGKSTDIGAPLPANSQFQVGDVDTDGHMWIAEGGADWIEYDVNPSSSTYLKKLASGTSTLPHGTNNRVLDWVYMPSQGQYLWSIDSTPALLRWDMKAHTWSSIRSYNNIAGDNLFGAIYGTSGNTFFANENTSGQIVQVTLPSGDLVFAGKGNPTSLNDGARCAKTS